MKLFGIGILLLGLTWGNSGFSRPRSDDEAQSPRFGGKSAAPERPVPEGGSPGYVLFSPLLSTTTYLIDKKGKVVHLWESDLPPGACVHPFRTVTCCGARARIGTSWYPPEPVDLRACRAPCR